MDAELKVSSAKSVTHGGRGLCLVGWFRQGCRASTQHRELWCQSRTEFAWRQSLSSCSCSPSFGCSPSFSCRSGETIVVRTTCSRRGEAGATRTSYRRCGQVGVARTTYRYTSAWLSGELQRFFSLGNAGEIFATCSSSIEQNCSSSTHRTSWCFSCPVSVGKDGPPTGGGSTCDCCPGCPGQSNSCPSCPSCPGQSTGCSSCTRGPCITCITCSGCSPGCVGQITCNTCS